MSNQVKKAEPDAKEGLVNSAGKAELFDMGGHRDFVADFRGEALEVLLEKKIFHLFMEYYALKRSVCLKEFMDRIERTVLVSSLSMCQGNQKKASRFLGLKYTTLSEKIRKHRIPVGRKSRRVLSLLDRAD
jgi:DNA-binding NtrC family response regulator